MGMPIAAKTMIPQKLSLFRRLKEQGIHICVDTNGSIWNEDVEELLKLTDLVLLDIKEFNNTRHLQLTERSNEPTLHTAQWLEQNDKPFWLRYVLVPGYTVSISSSESTDRKFSTSIGTKSNWNSTAEDDQSCQCTD